MGAVQVEPREGSYVLEWRAVKADRDTIGESARLLRTVGASVFADLAGGPDGIVVTLRNGQVLHASGEDWIVISPHDKVMVFDYDTFAAEFEMVT